mmetsp:Transcript_9967/g.26400  ORF Transcript_9967/g.26400 Transcript_9967/m.26400 type:complete len:345 (-) Transcript_9967:133-1167(-)
MGQNCVASTSIGCLFCCHGCNPEKLRNSFTFQPPHPASYALKDEGDENRFVYRIRSLERNAVYRKALEAAEVRWVDTKRGSRIPVVWVRSRPSAEEQDAVAEDRSESVGEREGEGERLDGGAKPQPFVLLHCHGNATDLGYMMGPYYHLATTLGIDVVGMEYSGYGSATGSPSEKSTYADVEATYKMITAQGVPPERIVVYGQSVGSGPASCLASKQTVGGLVLHSPLLSGIRVIDPLPDACCRPSCVWSCFDFFPNNRRVRTVKCPVLVMHGRCDEIIPFYHGSSLHQGCLEATRWPPYFPAGAGHNDLVEVDPHRYFGELSTYLRGVAMRAGRNGCSLVATS